MQLNLSLLLIATMIQVSLTCAHEDQNRIVQRNLRNVQEKVLVTQETDCCPPGKFRYDFKLHTDFYPEQTTWVLSDSNENVISTGSEYTEAFTTYTASYCLVVGCYTFTIFDSGIDGICCLSYYYDDDILEYYGYGEVEIDGFYEGTLYGDELAFSGGDFSFGATESFCGIDVCMPTSSPSPTEAPVAPTNEPSSSVECCPAGQFKYDLKLKTDFFPQETSWELKTSNGETIANSPDMIVENFLHTDTRCLPVGCYNLLVYDAFGDGICCFSDYFDDFHIDYYGYEDEDVDGFYEVVLYGNQLQFSGGSFGFFTSHSFCGIDVCAPTSAPTEAPTKGPTISPTVTSHPSDLPSEAPSKEPTASPTVSSHPSDSLSEAPSKEPTAMPTMSSRPSPSVSSQDSDTSQLVRALVAFFQAIVDILLLIIAK